MALANVSLASCSFGGAASDNHIVFVFANDGSVASAHIDAGPIAGRPEAACVAERFARIRVPAFAGPAVTLGTRFRLPAPGEGGCSIPYLVDANGLQYFRSDCH